MLDTPVVLLAGPRQAGKTTLVGTTTFTPSKLPGISGMLATGIKGRCASLNPHCLIREFRRDPEHRFEPLYRTRTPSLAPGDGIPPGGIEDFRLSILKKIAGDGRGLQQVLGGLGPLAERSLPALRERRLPTMSAGDPNRPIGPEAI